MLACGQRKIRVNRVLRGESVGRLVLERRRGCLARSFHEQRREDGRAGADDGCEQRELAQLLDRPRRRAERIRGEDDDAELLDARPRRHARIVNGKAPLRTILPYLTRD